MNFKAFFYQKNQKKGVVLPQVMTWRVGPDGLTWQRADVERGTTAPLRRGTEATWQDACGPRVTQA